MTRFLSALVAALIAAAPVVATAQGFTALARLDPARSEVVDTRQGTDVTLTLSQPVPYRVALWADPARLVLDFRTVDFALLGPGGLLRGGADGAGRITGHRHGRAEGDWSRLILDLAEPMQVARAGMRTDTQDGSARIEIALAPTDADSFRATAQPGAPAAEAPANAEAERFIVALDPGHGGADPGAVRDGIEEADLMLALARELREALRRTGAAEVVLTREDDSFVSLEGRIAAAKRAGADVFVSLHADAIAEGTARGAQVYTLGETASSAATAQLAERHDRADLLEGVDLRAVDDGMARVMMSMARAETAPRSIALAQALVAGLDRAGLRLHGRAHEQARFSVLKSADMPSVLIEVGFMSSPGELENLQSPEWRARAVLGIASAILAWRAGETARADDVGR